MLLTSTIFAGSSIYAQGDAESQNGKTDEFLSCLNVTYVPPCVDEDGSTVFSCDDPRHFEFENQGCAPESSNQSTDIFGGNATGFGEFPADEFGGNATDDLGFGGNATDEFGGNATGFGEFPADEFGGNATDDLGFGGNATDDLGFGGNATDEFGGNATGFGEFPG